MIKKEREELIKKAEDSEMWILELRIGKQNFELQGLTGQGVLSNDNRWRKLILKRNIYRKILYKKYTAWLKGEIKNESNPKYADAVRSSNYNKQGEEDLEEEK